MSSFYSQEELSHVGLKSYGHNVLISRKCSIYGAAGRIDDFCILSGNITIGSNVHISAYVALYGSMGITLEDYTGISPRSTIFSAMDDFGGDYLIGPVHDSSKIHVTGGRVLLRRFSQIGAQCVVFPNLTIEEGSVVGACSLVNKSLDPWGIYYGTPAVRHRDRSQGEKSLIGR